MNPEVLNDLAKLRQRHGSKLDDAIRLLADGGFTIPSPQGRGRKKDFNASTLEFFWVLVEAKRRPRELSIINACGKIAKKGGLFIEKIEQGKLRRREIKKQETIRYIYYKAKKLLDDNPALRNELEYMLELRLESHRSKRSLFDIFLERWQADSPNRPHPDG